MLWTWMMMMIFYKNEELRIIRTCIRQFLILGNIAKALQMHSECSTVIRWRGRGVALQSRWSSAQWDITRGIFRVQTLSIPISHITHILHSLYDYIAYHRRSCGRTGLLFSIFFWNPISQTWFLGATAAAIHQFSLNLRRTHLFEKFVVTVHEAGIGNS